MSSSKKMLDFVDGGRRRKVWTKCFEDFGCSLKTSSSSVAIACVVVSVQCFMLDKLLNEKRWKRTRFSFRQIQFDDCMISLSCEQCTEDLGLNVLALDSPEQCSASFLLESRFRHRVTFPPAQPKDLFSDGMPISVNQRSPGEVLQQSMQFLSLNLLCYK